MSSRSREGWALLGPLAMVLAVGCASVSAQEGGSSLLADEFAAGLELVKKRIGAEDGRRMTAIDEGAAVGQIARNNLLLAAGEDAKQARAQWEQAETIFSPSLSAGFSYRNLETFERRDQITRLRELTTDFDAQSASFAQLFAEDSTGDSTNLDPNQTCVRVDGRLVNGNQCSETTAVTTAFDNASYTGEPDETYTLSLGLSKHWAFGGTGSLSLYTKYHYKHYYAISGLYTAVSADDPFLLGSHFRWTSGISGALYMPLPYSKDWGELGNANAVGVEVAGLGAGQSVEQRRNLRNQLIFEARNTYWELVRQLLHLRTYQRQAGLLEQLYGRAQRQRQAGEITAYDLSQVGAELHQAREQVELVWNRYVVASNNLAALLNEEVGTLFTPAAEDLERITAPEAEAGKAGVPGSHPLLAALQKQVEITALQAAYRRQQLEPDLQLQLSFNYSQNDSVAGYEDVGETLDHLFDPDSSSYFIGFTYRIPLGNRANKAAHGRAQVTHKQARDRLLFAQGELMGQLEDARAAMRSSDNRRRLAAEQVKLAQFAFERVQKSIELGEATEFERLRKLQDLIRARQSYVDAMIDGRQAWLAARAAEGAFAGEVES